MFTDHAHVHTLAADADLDKRKIQSKGAGVAKNILMLLGASAVTVLLALGHFPRAQNHKLYYHFINNQGTVEAASMCTRFMATPLLFTTKFVVKSLLYKGRTIIIKIPLVRHVMPKRELRAFLRRRQGARSNRLSVHMSGQLSSQPAEWAIHAPFPAYQRKSGKSKETGFRLFMIQ